MLNILSVTKERITLTTMDQSSIKYGILKYISAYMGVWMCACEYMEYALNAILEWGFIPYHTYLYNKRTRKQGEEYWTCPEEYDKILNFVDFRNIDFYIYFILYTVLSFLSPFSKKYIWNDFESKSQSG